MYFDTLILLMHTHTHTHIPRLKMYKNTFYCYRNIQVSRFYKGFYSNALSMSTVITNNHVGHGHEWRYGPQG